MNMRIDEPQDEAKNAAAALKTLKTWLETAPEAERAARAAELAALTGSELSRDYDSEFAVDAAYRESLPDLQNGPASLIRGQNRPIQHVGISNFRLPLRHPTRAGAPQLLETSVTGTVSLEAEQKGINMSRILRSFYAHAEKEMGLGVVAAALDDYKRDLGSFDARIALRFAFPMQVESLRSGLSGYQYYDVTLELAEAAGARSAVLHLDYVYSSTCPCSLELSEHARASRGRLATPHSQRSVARISVALTEAPLTVEDLVDLCRAAVPTETQVMVKREDEQAFAELNAANPIFVEDAVRLFAEKLQADPRVGDFRVVASHKESLHSHDAVSVLCEGKTFAADTLDPRLFAAL
ncbi:GTP cyclohydrolase [Defluviimonas sp. 20V17]|uniref:GTP cyclohydrolase FolE2 n=1 Tax=Allgaiera indica TaxID=765699 RepID=A0AAN4UPT7_9RHOB|nr:GTP cyclohydrolase FolE2 [Allgaiera indica]KDB03754.1 GTP cyclohydrolase [Defluviimonas sp. 20V17]GHE00004.1 GTP cyclohydrolase FolE2 [Allgaiera indica]SDW38965.1 GTP cyclohydrolase I [Allgaiera indica]